MTLDKTLAAIFNRGTPLRNLAAVAGLIVMLAACGGGAPLSPPSARSDLAASAAPGAIPAAPRTIVAKPASATSRSTPQPAPVLAPVLAPVRAPTKTASADPTGMIRVGFLAPISGPSAPIGQGLVNAAQMALFDAADDRFVLQVYDTAGTPDGAAQAAAEAVSHGARLLLGPLFAGETKAVAAQAEAAAIDVISFSTDPSVAGGRVHVLGFLVRDQVREVVAHARASGFSRFAVLAPNTIYGQTVVDALSATVPGSGSELTRIEYFDPSGTDLEDVVRRLANYDQRRAALDAQRAELAAKTDEVSQLALKRLERIDTTGDVDFDAIFIPEQGARLAQAASLLSLYDVEPGRVQLLGTMLWNSPNLGREPAMIGAMFPAPEPAAARDFAARYRQVYGAPPPPLASHGYDAVALASVLARAEGASEAPFTSTALTNPAGFAGVDGIFRLRADGLAERGFSVLQITRAGAEVVKPAPTAFNEPMS